MIKPPQVLPEEPTAVTPHGGFCGGKSQQWLRYPTKPPARICEGEAEWPSYSTATRCRRSYNVSARSNRGDQKEFGFG
jgi:hypothetical protein